jgi:hypothetical protein
VFKKRPTFAIKTPFYNILSTVPFKVVPSTGDTQFPTFLPLLECFLERTFCDGAQFSYRIFLNLRVFRKKQNFLNSSPTSTEGALRLLSAPSGRFWQQTAICPVSLWALVVRWTAHVHKLFVGLIRRTAYARAQFSGCSSTNNAHSETGKMAFCCHNLPLGGPSSRSAPSLLVGELFKKFGLFLSARRFRKMRLRTARHHRMCVSGSIPTREEKFGTVYRQ